MVQKKGVYKKGQRKSYTPWISWRLVDSYIKSNKKVRFVTQSMRDLVRCNESYYHQYKDNSYENYYYKEKRDNVIQESIVEDNEYRERLIEDGYDSDCFEVMTVEERLALPDSYFPKNRRETKIRVPSLKRNKSVWEKFYNTFPSIAADVRTGKERFINGAKLKYIW